MARAAMPTTVQELEHAAYYLTTSASVSALDRQLAEEVFRLFKSSGEAFQLAKLALDTTPNTYVIFQAVQALTAGLIRDWQSYKRTNPQLIREVYDYLFYILCSESRCKIVPFVEKQLCRSIAIIGKKSLVTLIGSQCQTGFVEVIVKRCTDQLKDSTSDNASATPQQRAENVRRCSNVLLAMLEEIQNPKDCREIACSIKAHLTAKKAFQRSLLPKLFEELIALNYVCGSNSIDASSSPEQRTIFSAVLGLLEAIFLWDFRLSVSSNSMTAGVTVSEEHSPDTESSAALLRPVFSPPYEFGRLLFPPRKKGEIQKFLFQLYFHLRNDAVLAEKAGLCLVQMASLSGETLVGTNDADHLTSFISYLTAPEFSTILSHPNEQEIDMVACIFSNLITYTNHSTYENVENEDLEKLVKLLAEVTVAFGLQTLHEQEDADNIGMSMPFAKAYADLLTTWQTLLTLYNSGMFATTTDDELFAEHCFRMLQCFVHVHVSAPLGARIDHEQHYVVDDIHEIEESDAERFEDQLQVVGLWARLCMSKALPFLDNLLEQVVQTFEHAFWSFIRNQQQQQRAAVESNNLLYKLYEDLTWTMMIVSHVVFPATNDDVENEIPSGIVKQCDQPHVGQVSTHATCQHFISQLCFYRNNADFVNGGDDAGSVDPFIRFVARMFRLPAMLMQQQESAGDARLHALIADALSPQIIQESLLFVTKWVRIYTLPNDVQVHMLSTTLNAALKTDEACVTAQLEFALKMALFHLKSPAWSSEPSIADHAADLVQAVCGKCTWDKFNAQFFTQSEAMAELFYELSRNSSAEADGNVLALQLTKDALVKLYRALTVAVVSIVNIEDVVEPISGVVSGGVWGGGGAVTIVTGGGAGDASSRRDDSKREFIEKAQAMWQHLIASVTDRFNLALQPTTGAAVGGRDLQWRLIIAALSSSVGIVAAQLQHGTAASSKIFGLAQYICDSSHHCSSIFDAWCNQHLSIDSSSSAREVNEVLLNFAPILFLFYSTVSSELSTSITAGVVNDAALQNNICSDLHALVTKWRFLLVTWVVGDTSNSTGNNVAVSVRRLEHDETQRAYQGSFCACCRALELALSNLACLSIGMDDYFEFSKKSDAVERHAVIDSLASHLVACLTCVLDVITDEALMMPAVSLALFGLINRFLNALPKRTIFTLISEHRFDRLIYTMRYGIEVGGGGVGDAGFLMQTYEALGNVALEIAYVIGAVRSACAPLSRGFADVKTNNNNNYDASNVAETDAAYRLDAGQKNVLSTYMSNILDFILNQLFSGHLPSIEVSGVMGFAVYGLICCCRTRPNGVVVEAEVDSKFMYQIIFERALMQVADEVVRTRLTEHCVSIVNFIEQKAVIRSDDQRFEQMRVEKKLKLEFRDDLFSPLFTDARMLISVNLLRNSKSSSNNRQLLLIDNYNVDNSDVRDSRQRSSLLTK